MYAGLVALALAFLLPISTAGAPHDWSPLVLAFTWFGWLKKPQTADRIEELEEALSKVRRENAFLKQHFSQTSKSTHIAHWEYAIKEQRFEWELKDPLKGKSLEDFVSLFDSNDQTLLRDALSDLILYHKPFSVDLKTTTEEWLRITGDWDKHSSRQRIFGLTQDITEAKKSQNQLFENQERFFAAFHNAPIGLAIVDLDDNWLKVNPKVCDILGYSEEEFARTNCHKLCYPDDLPQNLAYKKELLEGRRNSFQIEQRFVHQKGHAVKTLLAVSMVKKNDGSPKYFIAQFQDITRERTHEAYLIESEKQLSSLIRNMPAAIHRCCLDEEWTTLFMSSHIKQICGYAYSDFIQNQIRSYQALIHPEDHDKALAEIKEAIAQQEAYSIEYRIIHADGSMRWVLEKGSQNYDNRNQCNVIDSIIFDITERIEKEREFKDLNYRFKVSQESSQFGIWEYNLKTQELKWDEFMLKIYGYTDMDAVKTYSDWEQSLLPEDLDRIRKEIGNMTPESQPLDTIFRIRWPDDSIHQIRAFAKIVSNDQDEGARMIGTNWDVTHQLNIESELSRANNRFSLAAKSANIGIWEIELTSEQIHWDEQMYQLFHQNSDTPCPTLESWLGQIHPEDRFHFLDLLNIRDDSLSHINWDFRATLDNNTTHYMRANAQIIRDPHNRPVKAIGSLREVTQQKQAEEAILKAKEKAENADKAKSAFLATMSHEIRTPMNAVIGLTQILMRTDLDEEQREYIKVIESSGKGLLEIIDDILDYSKIEADKLELKPARVNPAKILEECIETMAQPAHRKNLDLALNIDPDLPSWIKIDPHRLRQIIINLLSNAVKFTEAGFVTLSISAQKRTKGDLLITCVIADSGIGIPKKKQNRLFKSFSQVDEHNTRKNSGTGLGLAISKKLVHLMGGDMWVDSSENKGSRFHFTLCCQAYGGPPANKTELPKKNIGLIELPEATLNTTQNLIQQTGATPIELNDLDHLIHLQQSDKTIDCVIIHDQWAQKHQDLLKSSQYRSILEKIPTILLKLVGSNTSSDLFNSRINLPIRSAPLHLALKRILQKEDKSDISTEQNKDKPPSILTKLNVLVAEDQTPNQLVVRLMLEELGCHPTITNNGQEAIEALREDHYDVILMDIQMPVMDGLEATVKIMEEFDADKRPVIVALTAGALPSDREKAAKAGIREYLAKPLQFEQLTKTLLRIQHSPQLSTHT